MAASVLTPKVSDLPRFGNPIMFSEESAASAAAAAEKVEVAEQHNSVAVKQQHVAPVKQQPPRQVASTTPASQGVVGPVQLINQLNPYQNRWTIRARVLSKGDIKTWKNARGEGQLFTVGQIRATGFKDTVTLFYDALQIGQVYNISKATIKTANKAYSTIDNDYEMTLDVLSVVEKCDGSVDVPQINYKIGPFADLPLQPANAIIDVLAIVKEIGPIVDLISKSQKPLRKRDLVLVDESGWQVRMTIWGRLVDEFDGLDTPVMGMKGAKVGEYGGRSLSSGFDSALQINPDVAEAHRLKGWWSETGHTVNFQSFVGGVVDGARTDSVKTVGDVGEEGLGAGEKPDYFSLTAMIHHMKQENISYPACPLEGCNKKVTQIENSWRCEKCDATYPSPQHRVSDYTGNMWLQCFNEQAEFLLGKTANEMNVLKESDTAAYEAVFQNAAFQTVTFKIRAKSEIYQEEQKVRCAVTSSSKVDWVLGGKDLVKMIDGYMV